MKLLIVTHNISAGGAATACRRLMAAFQNQQIDVGLLSIKERESPNVLVGKVRQIYSGLLSKLDIKICQFLSNGTIHWQSSGLIGVLKARQIKRLNPTAVNIHWIGHATISIRQLKKIDCPIIITMHDEWWLNALNHYRVATEFHKNSPLKNILINIILREKIRLLGRPNVNLVCPSKELKELSIEMIPAKRNQSHEIPNPVSSKSFYPLTRNRNENKVLLFAGGTQDQRKGFDLLVDALRNMKEECKVTVLGKSGVETTGTNQQITITGKPWVKSESEMNRIYGESSLTIVPSRQEAFGQVASESLMTGTPVASFEVGGLKDIVINEFNGFTVKNFDTVKMAEKLDEFLRINLFDSSKIATEAKSRFSEEAVIESYLKLL